MFAGNVNTDDYNTIRREFTANPFFLLKFLYDNNPAGLKQSFTQDGLTGTFANYEELENYIVTMVQNGRITTQELAIAIMNVPFDNTVINYTTTPVFAKAFMNLCAEHMRDLGIMADAQARGELQTITR